MKVLDPGHVYELASLDGDFAQILTFVKRQGEKYPGNVGEHPGCTIQEVVRCLLERLRYLNAQTPCIETELCIGHLQAILVLHELRAARRNEKTLTVSTLAEFEDLPVKSSDGHVTGV